MEFTNEIFFSKKLTSNETVIITYCGKLYSEHSEHISIVYGYGDNWDETSEAPMKEIENGFEVTLEIKNYNTFNFCFKNNFNIWDNNSGFNYISKITPKEQIPETIETLDSTKQETTTEISQDEKENDTEIESLFSTLLDSILEDIPQNNEEINPDELNGFGLQSVDEIKEENFVNPDDIFKEFYNELASIPTPETTNLITNEQLNDLFNSIFTEEASIENSKELDVSSDSILESSYEYENYDQQELDDLMDNLINSIVLETASDVELSYPIDTIEEIKETEVSANSILTNEVVGLPAQKSTDWFENFIDNSYKFLKKVGIACKKFGTLLKLKAQEYGIIKEK
jgi:hypothetical protein